MKRRPVKITGLGFVTPAGIGKIEFAAGIQLSRSRVRVLEGMSPEAGVFVAANIPQFSVEKFVSGWPTRRLPRHTQFALAGVHLALEDAGLAISELRAHEPVVMIGAALMDFGAINRGVEKILKNGPNSALPTTVSDVLVSSINAEVAAMLGVGARSLSFQSACCSGIDSVGQAAELIASGEADFAICGGTEAPLHLHPMLEMRKAGLSPNNPFMPERQSRPFDRWRTTGVLGEGACIVILEAGNSPRRGYAEVAGYGFASDLRGDSCSGLSSAIKIALGNARTHASGIDAISAWGPGHREIDAAECESIRSALWSHVVNVPSYSIKGAIGNPFAAGSAIQVGCAALCMREGFIPPTVNWQYPDPACPLNLSSATRYVEHSKTLINAHGLSGTNSCLVLSK